MDRETLADLISTSRHTEDTQFLSLPLPRSAAIDFLVANIDEPVDISYAESNYAPLLDVVGLPLGGSPEWRIVVTCEEGCAMTRLQGAEVLVTSTAGGTAVLWLSLEIARFVFDF